MFKPYNGYLVIKEKAGEQKVGSILLASEKALSNNLKWGVVLYVADDVEDVIPSDIVLFPKDVGEELSLLSEGVVVMIKKTLLFGRMKLAEEKETLREELKRCLLQGDKQDAI